MTRSSSKPDARWWFDVAEHCDYATFFHTPLWSELAVRTFPELNDITWATELPSGLRVVVPLVELSRCGRGRYAVADSAAFGCYGGMIADGPVPPEQRDALYEQLLHSRVGELTVTENPYSPLSSPPLRGFAQQSDFTHVLHLSGDADSVLQGMPKDVRYSVRKGRSAGVETRIATTLEDYRSYFLAYQDSLRRWGDRARLAYPWRLFEIGCELAHSNPDQLRLWLAERDGQVLAGAWVFYWNRHAVYWHGASYEHALPLQPASVVLADSIGDAARRGFQLFDFNPSGGLAGVAAFKSQFGATITTFNRLRYEKPLLRKVRKVRGLFRAAARRT